MAAITQTGHMARRHIITIGPGWDSWFLSIGNELSDQAGIEIQATAGVGGRDRNGQSRINGSRHELTIAIDDVEPVSVRKASLGRRS